MSMKNVPIIGGPLDGQMTDCNGAILDAYLPPSPEWAIPSERICIRTQYERRRIAQDWGSMQLEGEAYVWRGYNGDPLVAVMSRLIAQNMNRGTSPP